MSPDLSSAITDAVHAEVADWQSGPLELTQGAGNRPWTQASSAGLRIIIPVRWHRWIISSRWL